MLLQEAKHTLQRLFGYSSFKSGQEELVTGILSGRDCLGVMPTGAGKSICYQLPAVMREGVTIVISPLISLMKDQVDALNETGIPTASINSTMTVKELNEVYRNILQGSYKLVYVAPERLDSDRFLELIRQVSVPLIAVDEAHCISKWGHDFRPSYRSIAKLLEVAEPRPVVAAFTATATDQVKEDIAQQLRLASPLRVTTGYARSNLTFSVLRGVDKDKYIAEYVRKHADLSGIIYASTRKEVEAIHRSLLRLRIAAGKYHAGMSDDERTESQDRFLYDHIRVMVATNAFGMGIDKSNVRYVIHANMPKNIEAYYQEAGRAGRDGEPGECILLYSPQDPITQKFFIEKSEAETERKQAEYRTLKLMVDYCYTTDCLQRYIVRYFGEQDAEPCGRCGTCTDERELQDITTEALQIFSCIVRMKQKFGITTVAKVLKGSREARIRQFGFDKLSTFGIMSEYSEKDIAAMIQLLAADRYLKVSDGQYPVVSLAEAARPVLEGKEQVYQRIHKVKETRPAGTGGAQAEALFEALRELRRTIAEKRRVPPFTIFHDATLRDMCEKLPTDEAALMAVKGVGESKLRAYGGQFLECIRGFMPDAAVGMEE